MQDTGSNKPTVGQRLFATLKRPRFVLMLLTAWSLLALGSQILVNSDVFQDIHGTELDGALGGLAFSFNAAPLALVYFYCIRDPSRYHQVFILSLTQQAGMVVGNVYELAIGTFSVESVLLPIVGAIFLAVLSFIQIFEPRSRLSGTI